MKSGLMNNIRAEWHLIKKFTKVCNCHGGGYIYDRICMEIVLQKDECHSDFSACCQSHRVLQSGVLRRVLHCLAALCPTVS
jgi:hypothetical protein